MLGGVLAVPCIRKPLMRDRRPSEFPIAGKGWRIRDGEGRVLQRHCSQIRQVREEATVSGKRPVGGVPDWSFDSPSPLGLSCEGGCTAVIES